MDISTKSFNEIQNLVNEMEKEITILREKVGESEKFFNVMTRAFRNYETSKVSSTNCERKKRGRPKWTEEQKKARKEKFAKMKESYELSIGKEAA